MSGSYSEHLQLISETSDDVIIEASRQAFSMMPGDIRTALTTLLKLPGVNVTIAAAALCACFPAEAPCCIDEFMVLPPSEVEAVDYYVSYAGRLQRKASTLNLESNEKWTAHAVQKVLWTYCVLHLFNVAIPEQRTLVIPRCDQLLSSATPAYFSLVSSAYQRAVESKADNLLFGDKHDEFIALEKWHHTLPETITSRAPCCFLLKQELIDIYLLYCLRQTCPRQQILLIRCETEEAIQNATSKAFRLMPDLKKAIEELQKLSCMTVPLAAAVLSACYPDSAPCYFEECMVTKELQKIQPYSLHSYITMVEILNKKASELTTATGQYWSAQRVGSTLWAYNTLLCYDERQILDGDATMADFLSFDMMAVSGRTTSNRTK